MTDWLPQTYLLGLVVLLGGASVAVARQILRVRRDELTLSRLDSNDREDGQPNASELYELASVQLRKRLYRQAGDNLKQALKLAQREGEPAEAKALIQNALGFTLSAQGNYQAAVRHYRSALKAKPEYPVALNNLGYALEKQVQIDEARLTYQKVLKLDSANKTARKRLRTLERRHGQAA